MKLKNTASFSVLCITSLVNGCASDHIVAPISTTDVGEFRPGTGYLNGYLKTSELPDSLALLPPPPSARSDAQLADNTAYRALTALQNTPRGKLATQDANLQFPEAAEAFSCALGITVSETATPNINMLMRRTLADAGLATYKAKEAYQRTRPFVVFNAPTCTPQDEGNLAKDGSYPSGHSSIGWAWALVLVEVAPERTDALLQRGRAFAQSRGVCGVHWQSDIEAGRLVGAATVARLHATPVFVAQEKAARAEFVKAKVENAPLAKCLAEQAALALSSKLAP